MSDWIKIEDEMPVEHPEKTEWFRIKKGDKEIGYPVTFWDDDGNGTNGRFINIGFGKEENVTHWKRD